MEHRGVRTSADGQRASGTCAIPRCPGGLKRVLLAILACALTCGLLYAAMPGTVFGLTGGASGGLTAQDSITSGETVAQMATTWPDFRGSSTNNAVTQAATPRTKAEAGLLWVATAKEGYMSPAIIVDDEIVVTSGRGNNGFITKINKDTGTVIAEANMKNASAYALMPPTYADGVIFVTLSDGCMEAFDAKTLASLWLYHNDLGGQGNCPVVYSDGLVYTGYWSGESAERSFVCLNAETGKLVWEKKNNGGYYWAGALAVGDYLLFGGDDGASAETSGSSKVRCVNKRTGAEISSVTVEGDQRSTIVYDSTLRRAFFTTKPGLLYSVKLDEKTGKLSGLQSLKIDKESTATPLVYDGRVYVGGSSGGFASGTLSVVDASTLKMLYQLDGGSGIGGTVKSAPLVSTAYAGAGTSGSNNKLYLYFTVNNPPGGITALAVSPNSTNASQAQVISLFTPPSKLQQYCIASVICDNGGNLYYRNDSNYMMCISPSGVDPATFVVPSSDGSSSSSDMQGQSSSTDTTKGSTSTSTSTSTSRQTGSNIQNGTASTGSNIITARAATAGTTNAAKATTQANSKSSASSKSASSASSDKKTDSSGDSKGSAASSAGAAVAQSDSTRHTDAEAATGHLEEPANSGTPGNLVPAIVAGVAAVALIGMIAARIVIARRRLLADDDLDSEALEADRSEGPYGR